MTKILGNLFISSENGIISDVTKNHVVNPSTTILNTTDVKYGTGSVELTGNSAITVPNHQDFNLNGSDFTIDFWAKDIAQMHGCVLQLSSERFGANVGYFWDSGNLECNFTDRDSGSVWYILNRLSMGAVPGAQWTHYALVKHNDEYRTYRNGTYVASVTNSSIIYGTSGELAIGRYTNTSSGYYYLLGKLDNIRLVKGRALWETDFEMDDGSLFYGINTPVSSIYGVGHRGNLRGKAKQGWIRPTIKQFFTSNNWSQIPKV